MLTEKGHPITSKALLVSLLSPSGMAGEFFFCRTSDKPVQQQDFFLPINSFSRFLFALW
jgi:hypothetical protein